MDRQPTRIHPQPGDDKIRVVTFRDGPQMLPEVFVGFAESDEYPDLTYQEWINRVANKKIEARVVGKAISQVSKDHFAR